ncbi:MAG: hypothetical protein GX335_04265, partial [Firmicutes bacterium]|nr:hypothetical protein [Bacillota bacterium]
GDQAGEKAALRSINILSENGMQAKIAVLDSGEDPDRFVRSRSEKEVVSWLAAAVPFMEYRINRIISQYDLETREGKLAASTELVNILAQLDKAVEREEYIRYAAQRLRVSVQALAEDVGKKAGIDSHMAVENRHNNRRMPKRRKILGDELVEREVLRCLLHEPNVLEDLKKAGVLPSDFHHNEFRHLFSLILRNETDSQGADITEYLFSLGELKGSWQEYFQSFLIVLRKRRLQKIEEKLSSLENDKKGFDIRMELYRLLKEYYIVLRAGSKNDD